MTHRRHFLKALGAAAVAGAGCNSNERAEDRVPSFLAGYDDLYRRDPRAATLAWFRDAKFGLFLHYGVYSQLAQGEWVQLREEIPVAEYTKLKQTFRPDRFDAEAITDLALAAGMRYINLTSSHHDGFCLFRTNETDFSSVNSPAKRDLVAEIAAACDKKGLGLFLYYSYALDWRHPYFFPRESGGLGWPHARPNYDQPQPEYLFEKDEDFIYYINFAHKQLEEILYRYRPLAGIWLDPIMGYYSRPDLFPIAMTYEIIREARPGVLVGFKQGANGDEDFVAAERTPRAHPQGGEVAEQAWEKNQGKPIEICDSLQPSGWGYDEGAAGQHKTVDDVMGMLDHAERHNANLLLNSGPLPDGSIHPADVDTLIGVGKRLQS